MPESSRRLEYYFSRQFIPDGHLPPNEYLPPRDNFQEMLWNLAEEVILKLRDEVVAENARFMLTATAAGVSIAPDITARSKFIKENNISNVDYARDRLERLAAEHGFQFVSLVEPLRTTAVT